MPRYTLTDTAADVRVESFEVGAGDLDLAAAGAPAWKVSRRTLRGGRREGVDLIEVDNGALSFAVVPTRGMGLWRGRFGADRLGWDSPVHDGPVHPALVNLAQWGGIGWLEGFDELMVRCGLEHNGAPYTEGNAVYGLHGKIANIPAHRVTLTIDDDAPHAITLEGEVDEARLFGPHLRMTTAIRTTPGSNRLTVRDVFRNLGDAPTDLQVLYHWNFGPPFLEQGARAIVPAEAIAPRDARAVEGLASHDSYAAPTVGFAEQVYFYRPIGDGPGGPTLAILRNHAGDKAVVLRFPVAQLPCFTLWKNTGGARDGYVTGLEPATNYPNPKPVERDRGRVVRLEPSAEYVTETTLEVISGAAEVARVEAEAAALQKAHGPATVHPAPVEPFSPAS